MRSNIERREIGAARAMRRGFLLLAVVLGLLFGASSKPAVADSTCSDGYACFWTQTGYSGDKRLVGAEFGGTGWQNFANAHLSVKNHFSNRHVLISTAAGGGGTVKCLDPGQVVANTGGTASFRVTDADAPCTPPGGGGGGGGGGNPPAGELPKTRQWGYKRFATRHDEGHARVEIGGGYAGHLRFIDNLILISQRFRNAKGKPHLRLYQVSGALSIRLNNEGYGVSLANCTMTVPGGRLAPLSNGTRAFFPQEADEAPETTGNVNVGLNLGPFSISVPLPGLDLYSGDQPPQISWFAPRRSSKHSWYWDWDDGQPNGELLPFLGHWIGGAEGIVYGVACEARVTGYGAEGSARVQMVKRVATSTAKPGSHP
jgi:peptidase inhibitor family I36